MGPEARASTHFLPWILHHWLGALEGDEGKIMTLAICLQGQPMPVRLLPRCQSVPILSTLWSSPLSFFLGERDGTSRQHDRSLTLPSFLHWWELTLEAAVIDGSRDRRQPWGQCLQGLQWGGGGQGGRLGQAGHFHLLKAPEWRSRTFIPCKGYREGGLGSLGRAT